jgi:hypothetical protein
LKLIDLAGEAASWGDQMRGHFKDAPGGQHFWPKFSAYLIARIDYFAPRRVLGSRDFGGCVCSHVKDDAHPKGGRWTIRDDCPYHHAAAAQPWNHRIPWNCGNYYDGCNCEGGPYYQREEGE